MAKGQRDGWCGALRWRYGRDDSPATATQFARDTIVHLPPLAPPVVRRHATLGGAARC